MYKIIVIDDELYARDFLESCINDLFDDFKVCAKLTNGEEAIDYLKNNEVDVVFTDVKMPKKNGIEVSKYVYENKPETYVVIVSAYEDFSYAQQAIKYGVHDYLLKVIDVDELEGVINSIRAKLNERNSKKPKTKLLNREMFFYDIIFDVFENEDSVRTAFDELNTGIEYNNAVCDIVSIEFEGMGEFLDKIWHYDIDIFKYSLINLIQIIYDKRFVMFSKFSYDVSNIIVLRSNKEKEVDGFEIIKEIGDIFKVKTKLKAKYSKTISQLFHENTDNLCDENEKDKVDESHIIDCHEDIKTDCVERAIAYISENLGKNLTRREIADYVHLNEDYFGKIFKDQTGKKISEYILDVRMEKSIEMLKQGEKAESVCVAAGYKDMRNFRRLFLKYTGLTIKEFKETLNR
ncbi:MAG: response regulator [Clostridia bacterium]|nr:response regulator [Clostridia bacterium]